MPIENLEWEPLFETLSYLATPTFWSQLGHLGTQMLVDNLLLDHVGLLHVLDPAVHLGVFFKGDDHKTFLLIVLFY